MKRKRSRTSRRRPRKNSAGRGSALNPPPFRPTMKVNHKFRFVNDANGSYTITRANLLNFIVIADTTTATSRIIEAIRLKKVEMWTNAAVSAAAAVNTCSLEWVGSNSPSTVVSDTSMGVRPAHIVAVPPPSSSNRWWSMSGTDESDDLFILTTPNSTYSVVDVSVEIRIVETEAPTSGPTAAGATAGGLYAATLDGNGVSGTFLPVGYTVIP